MTVPNALPPIKTVLCAIDLSDISSHVLSMAAEVAEAYDAKLVVVHAVEVLDNRYDFIVEDIARRIELEAHGKVAAELAHLGKTREVPVEVIVSKGLALKVITDTIDTVRPDFLVIGSHGRRGLDHLLLGSVAERILRLSPVSVLVVRPARNPDLYKIVCAVDFSDCSRAALERALDLARQDKITAIKVLNIFEVPIGYLEAGLNYETAYARTLAIHQHDMAEFIKPYADCGVAIETVLEEGAPGPSIVKFASQSGTDLLVIGSHGKSFLAALLIGSISTKIVHRATVSVLAVKTLARAP